MSSFSATEIAFLMVACQQFVLAFGWLAGAALMAESRRAALHWALYAALSAVSLVLFVASVKPGIEPLRALANLCIVLSLVVLQRGVWAFFACPRPWRWHAAVLTAAGVATWFGLDPANGAWRVAIVSGALSALCLSVGWDMQREARARMELRWGAVLSVPLLLGGLVFGLRAGRAMVSPGTIVAEVTADSALNVSAAFSYLVIALVFQLTLVGRTLKILGSFDLAGAIVEAGVIPSDSVDIEALSYHGGELYVGLKAPQTASGAAIVLKVRDVLSAMKDGAISAGRISKFADIPLAVEAAAGGGTVTEGISDMGFLPDGSLLILGNSPKKRPPDGGGALWWRKPDGSVVMLRRFLGLKPEGISLSDDKKHIVIVFDNDRKLPLWLHIPIPKTTQAAVPHKKPSQ